jgi:hypothetical protein
VKPHTSDARSIDRRVKWFGCAKRGCDAVNPDHWAYGAYGKSWCLDHPPLRIRLRRWLGEDV